MVLVAVVVGVAVALSLLLHRRHGCCIVILAVAVSPAVVIGVVHLFAVVVVIIPCFPWNGIARLSRFAQLLWTFFASDIIISLSKQTISYKIFALVGESSVFTSSEFILLVIVTRRLNFLEIIRNEKDFLVIF